MKITKENLKSMSGALYQIKDGLAGLILGVERLKLAIDKSLEAAEAETPAPAKPIQLKLPILETIAHRDRLGDVGYEDEANPTRQAVGQVGGLATAGIERAPSPDRRPRGSVMVKDMLVNEKRRYWRWAKDRARCRAANQTPPSWDKWVADGDKVVAAG